MSTTVVISSGSRRPWHLLLALFFSLVTTVLLYVATLDRSSTIVAADQLSFSRALCTFSTPFLKKLDWIHSGGRSWGLFGYCPSWEVDRGLVSKSDCWKSFGYT